MNELISSIQLRLSRAIEKFPTLGDKRRLKLNQNYALDIVALNLGSVCNAMEFSNRALRNKRAE